MRLSLIIRVSVIALPFCNYFAVQLFVLGIRRDRAVMAKILEFVAFVVSSYSSWRFVRASTKWLLGCRSMRILVTMLRDLEVSQSTLPTLGRSGLCLL